MILPIDPKSKMPKFKIQLFLFLNLLLLLFSNTSVFANHVLGETVTYKHLSGNKYAINLVFYIDCNFVGSMPTYNYNIQAVSSGIIKEDTAKAVSQSAENIALCGTSLCVKKVTYRDTITLGSDPLGYHIWYNACCRNNNLNNIYNPGSNKYTLYTFIPASKYQNSSPAIVKDPLQTICANKKVTFNAGFYDPDGDSLVFKMVHPYNFSADTPHFVPSTYNPGYSVLKPFGPSSPVATIDSVSGVITAQSKNAGNYLLAVEVHEYRKDPVSGKAEYLGKVMVELTFIVYSCGSNREPIYYPDKNGYVRTISTGEKFCLTISGRDSIRTNSRLDTLRLSAYSSLFGKLNNFPAPYASFKGDTGAGYVSSEFCWTPACEHVTYSSPHLVTFVLEDEDCNVIEKTYSIYVKPKGNIHIPVLQCLDITGENEVKLSWKNPPNDTSFYSYFIYRKKLPSETSFTKIATITDRTLTGWTDLNAYNVRDTSYQYFITSSNSCGVEVRGSDTLQTLLLSSRNLPTGNTEFSWNKLNNKFKDNFIISIDTGKGLQAYDTINARSYIFPLCGRNLKLQLSYINLKAACLSRSAISGNYFIEDTIQPSAPEVKYVTVKNNSSIEIGFTKPSVPDVRSYNIYYKKNSENFKFLTNYINADTGLITFQHTGINAGTDTFSYYVTAVGSCPENISKPSDTHTAIQLTGKPGNNSNMLNWSSYNGFNVKQYIIETLSGNSWVKLDSFNNTFNTFIHDSLSCNHTKYYRIKAISDSYPAITSISDSIALTPFDTVAPPKPDLFVASVENTDKTNGKISIIFSGNKENNRSGYKVYRSENGGNFIDIQTVNDTATNKLLTEDAGLNTSENMYAYFITSLDSCGNESLASDTHTVVRLKAKAFNNYIQLDWSAYKGFKNWNYILEKYQQNTGNWIVIDTFNNSIQNYADSDITCHNYYEYRIKSFEDSSAFLSFSNINGDTAFENEPPITSQLKRVTVTKTASKTGEILIEWIHPASNDAASYNLYRSIDGTNWDLEAANIPSNKLSYTRPGLNTLQNSYYYKLITIDSCGNLSVDFSDLHQSILLKITAGNQEVNLEWNAYKGWKVKEYQVLRNGNFYATVTGNILEFKDTQVSCAQNYIYQITAVADSTIIITSNSNTSSAKPFDNKAPEPVYLSSVSVSMPNKEVEIKWNKSASFDVQNYLVYRRSAITGNLDLLDSTNNLFYIDKQDSIAYADCYFVKAKDLCGNISEISNNGCIIVLNAIPRDGYNELHWNEYKQWNSGINNYNIYKKEDSLQWIQIGSVPGAETSFKDENLTKNIINYCYQVEALENPGQFNAISRSTIACVHQDAVFKMPNTFTPHNDDELNARFEPVGMYVKNYQMQIYNRWGEMVFETKNGEGWDGKVNNKKAPEGVYFYIITVEGNNPGKKFYKGNLTLLW